MFCIALILWGGIAYCAWSIHAVQAAYAAKELSTQESEMQQSSILKLHALARDTRESREKLESLAHRDIVEILDSIEKVARDTRIPIEIGEAQSATAGASLAPLKIVSFVIQASGSFSQVLHVVTLLETLPSPSSVTELSFERLPEITRGGKNLWRVVVRARFFTTADISS